MLVSSYRRADAYSLTSSSCKAVDHSGAVVRSLRNMQCSTGNFRAAFGKNIGDNDAHKRGFWFTHRAAMDRMELR
jgi:hypothetical protein